MSISLSALVSTSIYRRLYLLLVSWFVFESLRQWSYIFIVYRRRVALVRMNALDILPGMSRMLAITVSNGYHFETLLCELAVCIYVEV